MGKGIRHGLCLTYLISHLLKLLTSLLRCFTRGWCFLDLFDVFQSISDLRVVLLKFVYRLIALGTRWLGRHAIILIGRLSISLTDPSNESCLVDTLWLCRRCWAWVLRFVHIILQPADKRLASLFLALLVMPIELFEDQDTVISESLGEHGVLSFLKAPD